MLELSSQNKQSRTNKHRAKVSSTFSKGGRCPEGSALWSPSAEGEIPLSFKNGARGEKCESISRGGEQDRLPFKLSPTTSTLKNVPVARF